MQGREKAILYTSQKWLNSKIREQSVAILHIVNIDCYSKILWNTEADTENTEDASNITVGLRI